MLFKRNKQRNAYLIKHEYLFGRDKYECSACGAVYDVTKASRRAGICPNCRVKIKKVKYDPQWIDEMVTFDDF